MRRGFPGRAIAVAAAAAPLTGAATPPAPAYDIVIRGGRVLDGAGNPWVRADLAIRDGRIVRIGRVADRGAKEIDATGRYVAPGFIDLMDQSGPALLNGSAAENKLRMGVTTVITGEGGTPVAAGDIPAYFARLERQGLPVNFATYYSAAQARRQIMGDAAATPTPAQMAAMKAEVAKAMAAGAFGLSSALIYAPGSFFSTHELASLAEASGRCGGFYATHLRDEGAGLLAAVREAIEIGERSGAKVEIFHLKAGHAPAWGTLMPQAVDAIRAARDRGVDVAADVYPYQASGTGLEVTVPSWIFADGREEAWKRLRDRTVRARLKAELAAGSQPGWSNPVEASGGWDRVVLANAFNPGHRAYEGMSIAAIGKATGKHPADAAWDILLDALPKRALALYFRMDERDIVTALRQPWTGIGSDAGSVETIGQADLAGMPHPRAYGTFPRIVAEYVRKRGVLTLEDAIRKMTSWAATRMGLFDRGVLREGMKADVVVIDVDRIEDRATWKSPFGVPAGIDDVIVNGVVAIDRGALVGRRSGAILRHPCVAGTPSG